MTVLFWVQHLLGSGHVRRALTVAGAIAAEGVRVVLVSGGPPAHWPLPDGVELVQLPPVRASDLTFAALLDQHDRPIDDRFRAERRDRLLALFQELRPRVVITEMFPFGRRAFRFELVPLLEAAGRAAPRPWRLASVRDILVHKPAAADYAWMRDLARAHYDRVLVHTDPQLVPFGLTFPFADALGERLMSTGYVVGPPPAPTTLGRDEVLVSAGGGRVGRALLEAALDARSASIARTRVWRLIAGGQLPEEAFAALRARLSEGTILERQRQDFEALLANSLLSVSQAGYNTVVEGLRLRKPMVLVPFETASETEQRVRAERLASTGLAETVWESELTPSNLARAIDRALARRSEPWPPLALDGAARTARLVTELAAAPHPEGAG